MRNELSFPDNQDYEHIRTWEQDGFRLELFDTHERNKPNHSRLAYQFYDNNVLVFSGDDYGCPVYISMNSDDSVACLLGFLSLKPWDTDKEYFDTYTPEQLAWCKSDRAEELGCIQMEMEYPESTTDSLHPEGL